MKRGEIDRTAERLPERVGKPGFYVVASRSFIAGNDDVSTVVCAPIYSDVLGLATEVVIGIEEGLPRACAIRCDFLTLMFKTKLTGFVSALRDSKLAEWNVALATAVEIPIRSRPGERTRASALVRMCGASTSRDQYWNPRRFQWR